MARLWSDAPTEEDRSACLIWRNADPANESAWQCIVVAQSRFNNAPDNSAKLITQSRSVSRRNLLSMAGFVAGGALFSGGYLLRNRQDIEGVGVFSRSQLSTSTGEIKRLKVKHGLELAINTHTDLSMPDLSVMMLDSGEIWLNNANPVKIETPNGYIVHNQGEIDVRHTGLESRVSLFNGHSTFLTCKRTANVTRLKPGFSVDFNAHKSYLPELVNINNISWLDGKLVAQAMPLSDFVAELSRYRKGVLRVSPELLHLSVTGVFSLANTDHILQQLQASFPVKVNMLTRYWVNISPA